MYMYIHTHVYKVVGCVGLLGGVVGKPPLTSAAGAAQDMLDSMLGQAAHTTLQVARSIAQELRQSLTAEFDAKKALLQSEHTQELHDLSVRLQRLTPSAVCSGLAEVVHLSRQSQVDVAAISKYVLGTDWCACGTNSQKYMKY